MPRIIAVALMFFAGLFGVENLLADTESASWGQIKAQSSDEFAPAGKLAVGTSYRLWDNSLLLIENGLNNSAMPAVDENSCLSSFIIGNVQSFKIVSLSFSGESSVRGEGLNIIVTDRQHPYWREEGLDNVLGKVYGPSYAYDLFVMGTPNSTGPLTITLKVDARHRNGRRRIVEIKSTVTVLREVQLVELIHVQDFAITQSDGIVSFGQSVINGMWTIDVEFAPGVIPDGVKAFRMVFKMPNGQELEMFSANTQGSAGIRFQELWKGTDVQLQLSSEGTELGKYYGDLSFYAR